MRESGRSIPMKILYRIARLFVRNIEDWIACIDLREAPDPENESGDKKVRATTPEHIRRVRQRYNMRVHMATEADLEAILQAAPHGKRDEFEERLRTSNGYVFYEGEKVGGWLWVTSNPRPREGMTPMLFEVRPKPGHAYLFDGFVAPHARGHGGIHILYTFIFQDLRERDFRRVFFTCSNQNHNMHRLGRRLGFEFVGKIRYRRILCFARMDASDLGSRLRRTRVTRWNGLTLAQGV